MGFLKKAILFSCVALISARTIRDDSTTSIQSETTQTDDYFPQFSNDAPFALPTYLELPNSETPKVSFYAPEPSTLLRAPRLFDNPPINYNEAPEPATDLQAPGTEAWNPDNDPNLYFAIPSVLNKQQLPTDVHPKKFNKELHIKNKPFSSLPVKEQLVLIPIAGKEFRQKQKELMKSEDKLAKLENQRELQQGPQTFDTQPSASDYEGQSQDYTDHSQDYTEQSGLSEALVSSLGIPAGHDTGNDRLTFHMAGHDGPQSYKFGYDTGPGHNRQFRYEERDKEGIVKGHYGFYDKHGKLQMMNYDAHPHGGFHAEGNFGNFAKLESEPSKNDGSESDE